MEGTSHVEYSHARHVLGMRFATARLLTLALGVVVAGVIAGDVGLAGFVVGLLLAALPVPIYVTLALWLDRFEAEPTHVLVRAFLWGAVVAGLVSLLANGAAFTVLAGTFGARTGDLLTGVMAAPAIEEIAKGIALLLLFVHHDDEFDNVTDGVVYAAMIGLGFAMTENALYYGRALEGGALTRVFLLRGVVGPFAHPLFTAMTGIGIGIARERHGRDGTWIAPALGLIGAILLHAVWNGAATAHMLYPVAYLLVMVPAFVAALYVAGRSARREAAVIRMELSPLVSTGLLERRDVDALCTVRGRLRALFAALRTAGIRGWQARRRFHAAIAGFAFQRWRIERGIETGARADARAAHYRAAVARYCTETGRTR